MKKWISIIALLIMIFAAVGAGFLQKKHTDSDKSLSESEDLSDDISSETGEDGILSGDGAQSDDAASDDTDDISQYDNEMYEEILEEDIKTLDEGNVVELDENGQVSVYMGGLTFTIKNVLFFDSYEDFFESDVFVEEYWKQETQYPNAEIIYIEYDLTNEKSIEWEFLIGELTTYYINERGYDYDDTAYADGDVPTNETGAIKGTAAESCYASIPEHHIDEKNCHSPVLEPGETVSLSIAFDPWDPDCKVSEYWDGSWYLGIPGSMYSNVSYFNIYEYKSEMFIKLDNN